MKKYIILSILACTIIGTSSYGQVADGITYQAVALDENGKEIAGHDISGNIIHSKQIGVRFSILGGSESGQVLYTEEHSTYTDQFGLFTLVIGHGEVLSGGTYQKLTDIEWGADKLFLKVEIDIKHTGNFKVMGIQQMMAVPFAFHALTSSSTTINYEDILNKPSFSTVAFSGNYNDLLNVPSFSIVATSGNYNDLLNKPTLFSGNYNDLTNKPTIPTKVSELTNDAGYITNPNDADSDPTNEIQTLSLEGNTLSISKGNSVNISSDGSDYSFKSIQFPQGINHPIVSLHQTTTTELTVPAGKTMYILHGNSSFLSATIGGVSYQLIAPNGLPTELSSPIIPSNTVLSYRYEFTYFLVDNDPNIIAVNFYTNNGTNETYTVPSGKNLIVKSLYGDAQITFGNWTYYGSPNTEFNLIIPSNTIISSSTGCTFTGYLIDDMSGGSSTGTVTDADDNVYTTVQIGTQLWMAENLRTTKLNDGTSGLGYIVNNSSWNTTAPAYCWYGNDINNKEPYGALYNWLAVKSGKICPIGWHVPNDSEWDELRNFYGGQTLAGGPLKEIGTTHWLSPNTGANNSSGFSGLPGGFRFNDGAYRSIREVGLYWSGSEVNTNEAKYNDLIYSDTWFESGTIDKVDGLSVRCIRD